MVEGGGENAERSDEGGEEVERATTSQGRGGSGKGELGEREEETTERRVQI